MEIRSSKDSMNKLGTVPHSLRLEMWWKSAPPPRPHDRGRCVEVVCPLAFKESNHKHAWLPLHSVEGHNWQVVTSGAIFGCWPRCQKVIMIFIHTSIL